jgi:hypothetical protein
MWAPWADSKFRISRIRLILMEGSPMSKQLNIRSLCISLFLVSSVFASSTFAASVETVGDLKVQGVVESTSGGFKFPDGTTLADVGNISANSASTAFQVTQSGSGHAIDATSMSGDAVHASATNTGIYGESSLSNGILGFTNSGASNNAGVFGSSHGGASGVYGQSTANGYGVRGSSSTGDAIHGESSGTGVYGQSSGSVGVLGFTDASGAQNAGVKGFSQSDAQGVIGEGRSSGAGVYGENSGAGYGVVGYASGSASLAGGRFVSSATNGTALVAESPSGTQVMKVDATGIHAGPGMTGTPLAHGVVGSNGYWVGNSHSSNVSAVSHTADTGMYEITIAGQSLTYPSYTTVVSLVESGPGFISYAYTSGKLVVTTYNASGVVADKSFAFIMLLR